MQNFDAIPILDYSLIHKSKELFLSQLRHALVNVGFLYLINHPVDQQIVDALINYIPALFALPQEAKDAIRMANSPHFLGYSRLGAELTKGAVDQREQFDIATDHVCRWKNTRDPDYYRLWGPSQLTPNHCRQWPDEKLIPGFRDALERYMDQVTRLTYEFSSLIAESLGLPPDGLSQFYDTPELMQHRGKIVKYPVDVNGNQGVGPHYDGGFLTFVSMTLPPLQKSMFTPCGLNILFLTIWRSFVLSPLIPIFVFIATFTHFVQLLQASPHKGLQVQNLTGEWIDAPPIPGSFVINFGKGKSCS
ncbi:hypothetical protein AX17_004247 [Amanita inopinata Kibby_2008]|nr:hypothetical protein AX17_004247 [Amanita inopinata Kibby_2008]